MVAHDDQLAERGDGGLGRLGGRRLLAPLLAELPDQAVHTEPLEELVAVLVVAVVQLLEDVLQRVGELPGDGLVVQRDVESLLVDQIEVDHDDLGLGLLHLDQGVDPLVTSDHGLGAVVPDDREHEPEFPEALLEPLLGLLLDRSRVVLGLAGAQLRERHDLDLVVLERGLRVLDVLDLLLCH